MKKWIAMLSAMKRRSAELASADRGVSAVEFAILAPVLVTLTLGLIDYGMAMFKKMELVSAVRSGAQYALADKTNTTAIRQAVVDATNLDIALASVTATEFCECSGTSWTCGTDCAGGGNSEYYMTVGATYSYTPLLLPTVLNLTGTVTLRTE